MALFVAEYARQSADARHSVASLAKKSKMGEGDTCRAGKNYLVINILPTLMFQDLKEHSIGCKSLA